MNDTILTDQELSAEQAKIIAEYVNGKYPNHDIVLTMWLKMDLALALAQHEHIPIPSICNCARCMLHEEQQS